MIATNSLPVYGCIDCQRPIDGSPSALHLCPTCRKRADEAQRDHRVREAAHDMLAALEGVVEWAAEYIAQGDSYMAEQIVPVEAAIAKARGGANE